MIRPPRRSPLFPSPPLSRSLEVGGAVVEPRKDVRVEIDQSSPNARKSSHAACTPSGTYSATSRSFGEWSCESGSPKPVTTAGRSEEHTSELQSPCNLVCRLL